MNLQYGNVGNLKGSCKGEHACYEMAYNGSVGNLQGSCNDQRVKGRMKSGTSVDYLTDSCNGDEACREGWHTKAAWATSKTAATEMVRSSR